MTRVFVSAADASGDPHTAEVVEVLQARVSSLQAFGVGGTAMRRAGVQILVPQSELAIGGLVEVAGSLRRVWRAWRCLGRALAERRPALALLVDSPDFHIPLARRLRRAGVPVLYYISPQVWAWRSRRVRKLARRVDRMAVIFPFEPGFYRGTGLPVEFVGHPLVERLQRFRAQRDRSDARKALGLEATDPLAVLLPGSRRNEMARVLPLQLEVARHLHGQRRDLGFLLALAPTALREEVEHRVAAARLPSTLRLEIRQGCTYDAVRAADVALAKPGTITLEVTLLGCPLVVAARAHPLSARLARRLVRVPTLTMPNLIAGAAVVPEFLQREAVPARIAEAMEVLLESPARDLQQARLAEVAARLGPGGAARRVADIAQEMLGVGPVAA